MSRFRKVIDQGADLARKDETGITAGYLRKMRTISGKTGNSMRN